MVSGAFMQQTVITASRSDMDLLFTYHIMKFVSIYSCSVYHTFGLIVSIIRNKLIAIFCFYDILHFRIESELYPVFKCILRQGDIQVKGTYDPGCRSIQRRVNILRDIGFHLQNFLPAQYLKPFHSVF